MLKILLYSQALRPHLHPPPLGNTNSALVHAEHLKMLLYSQALRPHPPPLGNTNSALIHAEHLKMLLCSQALSPHHHPTTHPRVTLTLMVHSSMLNTWKCYSIPKSWGSIRPGFPDCVQMRAALSQNTMLVYHRLAFTQKLSEAHLQQRELGQ